MIINHRYKFIYIKTRKTAGTSLEIALTKFCDQNDVITPINEEDELIRKRYGYLGPQNYNVPKEYYSKLDLIRLQQQSVPKQYYKHANAYFLKNNISPRIWNNYFKFTFERNPFDKALSFYYFEMKLKNLDLCLDHFLTTYAEIPRLSNWHMYTINDHPVCNFIGRYEQLDKDVEYIKRKLNLPENIELPNAKGGFRTNRESYQTVLSDLGRRRIETVCAKEIYRLGYQWEK
jgi:hypothetical protein